MNGSVILRVLSGFLGLFAIPTFACSVWAFQNDRYQQASLFITAFMTSAVVSAILAVATHHRRQEYAQARDVVGFLIFGWLILAILGAIPFLLVADGSIAAALFEAVSCATTTGTTLLNDGLLLPASLVAWRGILHILGAILSVSGVVMVVNLVGSSLPGLSSSIPMRFNTDFSRESFFRIFLSLGAMIVGLCVLFAIPILIDGGSLRAAFGLSVGALTTGKVFDVGAYAFNPGWLSELTLILALIIGSVNIVLLFNCFRKPKSFFLNFETIAVVVLIAVLAVLLFSILPKGIDPFRITGIAASIVSTSGLVIGEGDGISIPVPVLLFFGFVGGAAISATGGMKIYRISVLLARAGHEFQRLAQPNAVLNFEKNGERFPVNFVLTVWAYLVAFAVISIFLAASLALMGADFQDAIMTALGSITNSAALIPTEWIRNSAQTGLVEFSLSAFMILGRLELLLLLSLVLSD